MDECRVMAVGVTGTCIVSLQTWLNIFDDADLEVDGVIWRSTERAAGNFQLKHGLNADGRFSHRSVPLRRLEFRVQVCHDRC
jgi:hypothetical protein